VGVRRIVAIEPPHARIAKQHAATAIGLQAMLMWINDNRIDLVQRIVSSPSRGIEIVCQSVITTVGGIDVDSEVVFLLKSQNGRQWINGARGSRSKGNNHSTNIPLLQFLF